MQHQRTASTTSQRDVSPDDGNAETAVKGADTVLRERRAMMEVEMRTMREQAKALHSAHSLRVTPHYSRSLHLATDDGGSSPTDAQPAAAAASPAATLPLLSTPLEEDTGESQGERQQAQQCIQELLTVSTEPSLSTALDSCLRVCTSSGRLRSDVVSTLRLLLSSSAHHLSTLACLHYMVLARCAQHVDSNYRLEREGARISAVLVCIHKQIEKLANRRTVMAQALTAAGIEEQEPEDTASARIDLAEEEDQWPPTLAADGSRLPSSSRKKSQHGITAAAPPTSSSFATSSLAASIAAASTPSAASLSLCESAMLKSDLEEYVRYSIPRVRTRQRISRLLLKLRWAHTQIQVDTAAEIAAEEARQARSAPASHSGNGSSSSTPPLAPGSAAHLAATPLSPLPFVSDLSEPPHFLSPRPIDLLPHGLTSLADIEAEAQRLAEQWRRERGEERERHAEQMAEEEGSASASASSGEQGAASSAVSASILLRFSPRSLNPFLCEPLAPGGIDAADAAGAPSWSPSGATPAAPASAALHRTRAPPSLFAHVSSVFPRIFRLQRDLQSAAQLRSYATLLAADSTDAAKAASNDDAAAAAEEEWSSLSDADMAARRAEQHKRQLEERHATVAQAKAIRAQEQRDADARMLGLSVIARMANSKDASSAAATPAAPSASPLRDSRAPIISSTGKIWGGAALNKFTVRDDREAEALLDGRRHDATAGGFDDAPVIAREDDSARVGVQPIHSFSFAQQRQADLLEEQSSGASGNREGIAPTVYLRKATFLRHSRIFPRVSDAQLSQRTVLREMASSSAVDQQLQRHFQFVAQNHEHKVAANAITRLASEHAKFVGDAIPDAESSSPTAATRPPHLRKNSLALVYGSQRSLPAASTASPASDIAAGLAALGGASSSAASSPMQVESTQHTLRTLYMLRVLRVRQLRARILGVCNYFVSMRKTLVQDEAIYASTDAASPSDLPPLSSRAALSDRCDFWSFDSLPSGGSDSRLIVVRDARLSVRIVYDAALQAQHEIEQELLALASIYMQRHAFVGLGIKGDDSTDGVAAYENMLHSLDSATAAPIEPEVGSMPPRRRAATTEQEASAASATAGPDGQSFYSAATPIFSTGAGSSGAAAARLFSLSSDRWSVLVDLFERECSFLHAKRCLLDVYMEVYSHTLDPSKLRALAQRMVDLASYRPTFDLDRSVFSFAEVYAAETECLEKQAAMMREVMYSQMEEECMHGKSVPTPASAATAGAPNVAAAAAISSAHAAFDWSLFAAEYPATAFDPLSTLSSLRLPPPGLPHPLHHPHSLLQFHPSFDCVVDVANALDACSERVESMFPLPVQRVRRIYLLQLRKRVLVHCATVYRCHLQEESPFPASQHLPTLESLDHSPLFNDVSYALVKLHAQHTTHRDQMTGATRRTDVPALQLYFNYCEALNTRQMVLAAAYETVILTRLYFQQAEKVGVEAPRTMLDMHAVSSSATGSASASLFSSSYLLSSSAGEVGCLSISEVFHLLPKDLFKQLQELDRSDALLSPHSSTLQHMRSTLQVQTMQNLVLATVVELHSALMSSEEVTDSERQRAMEGVPSQIRALMRGTDESEAAHVADSARRADGHAAAASRANPFVKMIAQIQQAVAEPRTGSATAQAAAAAAATVRLSHPRASRRRTVGALTPDGFVNIHHAKLHARQSMESFLATRAEAIRRAQLAALLAGADPKAHAKSTTHAAASLHLAALPAHTLVQLYVEFVLRSLSPELYCADLSSLMCRFRALHAGRFGSFSPFISAKFKMHGHDGFMEHILAGSTKLSGGAATPATAQMPVAFDPTGGSRWGGGFPAGTGATSGSVLSTPSYGSLFQMPPTVAILCLLQVDRSAICVETLRRDLLCRRVLYDSALLHSSLAQLEFLSSLSLHANKVAELTASRLDMIRNQLRELSSSAAEGAGSSFRQVHQLLLAERRIVWYRLHSLVRFVYESLLLKGDVLGVEYVQRIIRIIHCRSRFPVLAGAPGLEASRVAPMPRPWEGGLSVLLTGSFDLHSFHPLTALHSLPSLFLFFCDRRVTNSFEGLGRELSQMNKLVFRMEKEEGGANAAAAGNATLATTNAAAANSADDSIVPPAVKVSTSSALGRAQRTVDCMRNALALAQLFDGFYTHSFEMEARTRSPSDSALLAKAPILPPPASPSLANPRAPLFQSGLLYFRALDVADSLLVGKVNELRRRENAKQRGVVPLTYLYILEKNRVENLEGGNANVLAALGTLNNSSVDDAPILHSHALNSGTVFGFTLFALSMRPQDQVLILNLLKAQFSFDLFVDSVEKSRAILNVTVAEERNREQRGGYAADAKFASLVQSARLLVSEVQDASYEMNVIKEWLAGAGGGSSGIGSDGMMGGGSSAMQLAKQHKQYFVLHKERLNAQLTQLMREVMVFGDTTQQTRLQSVELFNGFMRTLLSEQSLMTRTLGAHLNTQVAEFTAQSIAQVTDTQYRLITQMQEMREQRCALQQHAEQLDGQIRTEVQSEYESHLHKLSLQLLDLRSKLDINNLSLRARILAHYYSLKASALEEMISSGSAPYLIKKRALRILNEEQAFQALKTEYYSLGATSLKMATLYQMKTMGGAKEQSRENRELDRLLHGHRQLQQSIDACESRCAIWSRELQETKNSLMLCHKYLEEMQRSFLVSRKENAKLNAWKIAQLTKLAKLEAITSKFDDVSEMDFDALESQMRMRAEEMETALAYERNADLRARMLKAAQDKKMKQVRRMIAREDRLIAEAHAKVASLSVGDGSAPHLDPTWEQRENDHLWEQRCIAAEKRTSALRVENDRLRASLNSQPTTAEEWKKLQKAQQSDTAAMQAHPSRTHAPLQWKH